MQCSPFSTRYDRIEPNKVRGLTIAFDPYPEAAPGDTVHVHAYYAGDSATSVSWRISYDVLTDAYGTDTFYNARAMPLFGSNLHLPDSQDFYFAVPESVFYKTIAIREDILDLMRDSLPQPIRTMTKNQLASLLDDIATISLSDPASATAFVQKWGAALGMSALSPAGLDTLITRIGAPLMALFSIKAYLFADIRAVDGKTLTMRSDFIIRYNSRISRLVRSLPASAGAAFADVIPVNTNPRIHTLGIVKVKGDNADSIPASCSACSLLYIYNDILPESVKDTVLIDSGYTYFIVADTGIFRCAINAGTRFVDPATGRETVAGHYTEIVDTELDRLCDLKGSCQFETFYYDWFFENLDLDSVRLPLDSLVTLERNLSPTQHLLPSLDTHMRRARFWVVVTDGIFVDRQRFPLETNRPTGMCYREATVNFTYTEAYRRKTGR
jgi:hypothetical protein